MTRLGGRPRVPWLLAVRARATWADGPRLAPVRRAAGRNLGLTAVAAAAVAALVAGFALAVVQARAGPCHVRLSHAVHPHWVLACGGGRRAP